MLTLALAILAILVWLANTGEAPGPAPGPEGVGAVGPTGPADPAPARGPEPGGPERPTRTVEVADGPLADPGPRDPFEGTGSLRGSIDAPQQGALPAAWTLVVEPSLWLPGKDRAVTRRVERTAGELDFDVADLPFGGYRVGIEASGWNCRPVDIVLDRVNSSPYVTLAVFPAGGIEGSVYDEEGVAVEGMAVFLEALPGRERVETTTDGFGFYRFEDVLDGLYKLSLGHPDAPIGGSERLAFEAPHLRVPDKVVPVFGSMRFTVLDAERNPVPGARVRGAGTGGGYISVNTDEQGRATARYLPAGRYRITGQAEGIGRTFVARDLARKEEAEVELVLEP